MKIKKRLTLQNMLETKGPSSFGNESFEGKAMVDNPRPL
jgi:hypothetical protein